MMASLTTFFSFLLLLAAPSLLAIAQPVVEPITQNPNAVLLRRIWTITGSDGNRVGDGCGPVGDINGDSISDFAVHFGELRQWRVYLGGSPAPTTEPVWVGDSLLAGIGYPVFGDFFGDGRLMVGFNDLVSVNQGAAYSYRLFLFSVENQQLNNNATDTLDPYTRNRLQVIGPRHVFAMNLDRSTGDELILCHVGMRVNNELRLNPEYWFYRGGASFQVDTPDYVVRDPDSTTDQGFFSAKVLDIDGDSYVDLVSIAKYADGFTLKMWFGTETSPWTWTTPDREITLDDDLALSTELAISDLDGDRKPDFASVAGYSTDRGLFAFLSRNGFNPRTTSFSQSEAHRLLTDSTLIQAMALPPWNDTTRRVAMLGAIRPGSRDAQLLSFSGSATGPNGTYDAFYSAWQDGLAPGAIFVRIAELPDANGDGWADQINSYFGWPTNRSGIAMILAGGPYIPLDQPTVGVRTEPMADHERGLYLWPNPATTELNIAWRGDLSAMPTRMAVHDVSGKLVAESELRPELGSARWATDGVASGRYLLTVYDRSGKVLASTSVVVQK